MTKLFQIALASMGAIVGCTTVATGGKESSAYTPGKVAPPQQRTNVTKLYNEYCGKCHGENGEGGGGGTQSLLTVDKFDQKWDRAFFDATRNGVPNTGMEPMGQTLSDQEIWGLVVHIRELQGKALRWGLGQPKKSGDIFNSKLHNYKVETVVDQGNGLKVPWSMDWLPDGKMLVTNRPGGIGIYQNGSRVGEIVGLPQTVEVGQGGQMEVAVHPNYASNGWVYISYAEPKASGSRECFTKVVRGKLTWEGSNARWGTQQTIYEVDKSNYNGSGVHFGCKIAFDGKGHVFLTQGERGGGNVAQEVDRPFGKVYRLNEDGSVPKDNPFYGKGSVAQMVWSFGHRNPQGLTVGLDGRIWDTEHGPRGGDELNECVSGGNYGWSKVAFSINYNDSAEWVPWPKPGENYRLPIFRWLPSIGASGLDVMKGSMFPNWKGDLIAGGLSGNSVDRIRTKDGKFVEREGLLIGMGRVRDIAVGPDGAIYVALNQPDKIVRLVATR